MNYEPNCYDCRAEKGKQLAGVPFDDLCHRHLFDRYKAAQAEASAWERGLTEARATIERLERDMASAAMVIGQRDATLDRLRAALERIRDNRCRGTYGPCGEADTSSNISDDALESLAASPKGSDPRLECEPTGEATCPVCGHSDPHNKKGPPDSNGFCHYDQCQHKGCKCLKGWVPPCPDCERNAPVLEAVQEWLRSIEGAFEMTEADGNLVDVARHAGLCPAPPPEKPLPSMEARPVRP